jgi:phosphonate transport system ATP-binding protein
MQAVAVRGLTKSFRAGKALADVELAVAPGEMVALIGASGAGKSTLIRQIAGLAAADAGEIEALGGTVQREGRLAPGVRALRAETGVIFQQFNLVGRLSLLSNLLIGLLGRISPWRGYLGRFTYQEQQQAMACLYRVGLHTRAAQRASTLSGGQQQRAAIARALLQRARLLLADEPIASLDPRAARRVMEILSRINRDDGVTVIVSLHQVAYAISYCPRAVALRDGQVVYDGDSQALTPELLGELYGADSESLFLPDAGEQPARAAPIAEPALAGL